MISINQLDNIILKDITSNGKLNDWQGKKINNILLSESYTRLQYYKKSFRIKNCGEFLEFKKFHDNSMKLNKANFCKIRLCPLCAWRRSLKIFGQVSKIMDKITEENKYEYLFLTLTTKNCIGADLSATITNLMKAFKELQRDKQFKNSTLGFFRALEVTHNIDKNSTSYDTYHPHFHCIIVVRKSYFTYEYINHESWTSIWRKCMKSDYDPIVYITKFKNEDTEILKKSISESAKYTVKDNDYIIKENNIVNELFTDSSVQTLEKSLSNRRLTAFGGILKDYHKLLNLDDQEEGDLINTDNETIRDDLEYIIERYQWNIGYKQYYKCR